MERRNGTWSVLIVAMVCALVSSGPAVRCAAQPLADRVPDDALVYVAWAGAEHPGSQYEQSRLKAFLDASQLPQLVNEGLPKILAKMAEKDRGAAIVREVVERLGPSFWRNPTALYVGPVDGLANFSPMPRIALLCQAGEKAPQLKKDINGYLDQVLSGAPVPVTASEEDGVVAVVLGNVVLDLSGKSKTSLASRKEFTEAMAQASASKEPLAVAYADIEGMTAIVDQVAVSIPQAAPKWAMVRDTLGLKGLKRIAWAAGFDGRDFATSGFVQAPAPRAGLLQLLDAGPVRDEALRTVPQSATMVVAGKFDFARLLTMAREIGARIDPNVPNGINSGLAMANVVVGINIERDLLQALGDEWIAYTSPTVGGVGPLGFVVVNHARDAARLEQALGTLEQLANGKINSDTRANDPRGQFVAAKIGGLTVHYFDTPFVTPAWTIKDGNLYVALYPQTAASAANAGGESGGRSILENENFRGLRKRLGAPQQQASSLTFFDLPVSAPVGYPYVLAASRVLGFADMFGMQTPPAVLPPLDKLMPLMAPAGSVAWTDDAGLHTRSVSPFPCATLFGGPEAILLEGQGLVAPMIVGTYRARESEAQRQAAPALRR